ncbi:carboxymuconolactone decarboxylase family protein [Arthrobacter sp. B6]|uniref:carboxymuconolactone decarboxylase family protein n=1 Tax=Arthrobacter sp. B6 TaxID=1570137 RepID=UPI003FA49CE4
MRQRKVDRALELAIVFRRPVQEFATEYAWGQIWCRPRLDLKARSMLNLAMLTALNRSHELEGHVHGALNKGVNKGDSGGPATDLDILWCSSRRARSPPCRRNSHHRS